MRQESIAVVANLTKEGTSRIIEKIRLLGKEYDKAVIVLDKYADNDEDLENAIERVSSSSLMVSIGGDGTLLHALRIGMPSCLPVLPIYNGTLGFIAEPNEEEGLLMLENYISNKRENIYIEKRRAISVLANGSKTKKVNAINEAVLLKGSYPRMGRFGVYINGSLAAIIKGDGVIISSPTGSTAYALSAGGPIVDPNIEALILVPIAPHSLTLRPLVLSGKDEIVVCVESEEETRLSVDGHDISALYVDDNISVSLSDECFLLIRSTKRSFYENLKEKLNWGL